MKTRMISFVIVIVVILSGCAEIPGAESPSTETTGTATTIEKTTTQAGETTEDKTPEKGSNLLSVTQINESTAMKYSASMRTDLENLNDTQQQVFERALECECNVDQEVFRFNDKDRIKVVKYNGNYYYLRATIV